MANAAVTAGVVIERHLIFRLYFSIIRRPSFRVLIIRIARKPEKRPLRSSVQIFLIFEDICAAFVPSCATVLSVDISVRCGHVGCRVHLG